MIRRVAGYFGIVWLLLPVTLLAQGAPGSIQGIVCEIKTCKPIDGVQVSLVHPGSEVPVKTMRTDVSGEFGFFDLEPGTYMVRADNFIRRIGGASAVITNGERIENIKLELTALGTISGGAFDENGEPVVDARVEALAELMNSPCKADSWRRHFAGPVCERVECAGAGRAGADTAFADRSRGAFAAGAEFGLDEFDRNDFRDPRRAARVVLPLWCNLQRRCGPTAMGAYAD